MTTAVGMPLSAVGASVISSVITGVGAAAVASPPDSGLCVSFLRNKKRAMAAMPISNAISAARKTIIMVVLLLFGLSFVSSVWFVSSVIFISYLKLSPGL
jgi:hypothetical protein